MAVLRGLRRRCQRCSEKSDQKENSVSFLIFIPLSLPSEYVAHRLLVLGFRPVAGEAALKLPWSQGQVEGHVHRLKLIKRQM